jgi:hypothetical protein
MHVIRPIGYIAMTLMVTELLAGCFSYHREVRETGTPAVEAPPASSTSTTTTTNDNGTVERHTTTTFTP